MEILKATRTNEYDLAITDPPYGINVNHNMGRRKGDKPSEYKPAIWDSESPEESYFTELRRVSKHQIIWGANHFISKIAIDSPCWIMWDKRFSDEVSFAQYELAWTNFQGTAKKYDRHPSQQNKIHPTQKPVALYRWILKNYAKAGQTILDTHGGSFSLAVACHMENFDLDIIEIDEEYFNAGIKRFKQETRQLKLL
jgi:site-specific DNA-methyltransferase (adenine-specific)